MHVFSRLPFRASGRAGKRRFKIPNISLAGEHSFLGYTCPRRQNLYSGRNSIPAHIENPGTNVDPGILLPGNSIPGYTDTRTGIPRYTETGLHSLLLHHPNFNMG